MRRSDKKNLKRRRKKRGNERKMAYTKTDVRRERGSKGKIKKNKDEKRGTDVV